MLALKDETSSQDPQEIAYKQVKITHSNNSTRGKEYDDSTNKGKKKPIDKTKQVHIFCI